MSPSTALRPEVPFVEGEDLEAHLAKAGLDAETEAFCRSLAQNGYALIDLGDEARALCDLAVADTDRLFARHPGANRIQDAWLRSKAVRRLAASPKVARMLEAAYGRKAFPFQTLNFLRGSQQGLHPDSIHFHSVPERFMCGVWIALEDVQPEAGPLVYLPGSHRLPVMTMRDAGVNDPRPSPEQYASRFVHGFAERLAAAGLPDERALVKKGWAFVWAANLAHGGAPVTDPASTRRSLVVHWYFENCLYYTPMTSDVEGGRLSLRMPANVATGGWEWPRKAGRAVYPGKTPLLAAILKRVFKPLHISEG
ncbi:phytanoyl-CoA dioxygenase family protein [Phenylobacterium sp. J367]|uniref:phytanoyl-CoA dioxygenase family protein n=1 Tax=Phenylobacterium sp. J367 TaxID=2898435 RepID=UPI002151961C|nr:phytanoyl-CoA dioxygenase family protein [Phenylobacterium sp. J367]MCR5880706.1 phytanoyl-CoA dioxygenase family protein [Phenylobacterium sp. J367]